MSKLCPYCKSKKVGLFNDTVACCRTCDRVLGKSQLIDRTLFERITESPEVLAEKLVYPSENFKVREWDAEKEDWTEPHGFWRSTLIPNRDFNTKSEAIAATVEKLKEV